jgi:4-alpha-glucanotransferase
MAPLTGFCEGKDLSLSLDLNLIQDSYARQMWKGRAVQLAAWNKALEVVDKDSRQLVRRFHEWLARSNAKLMLVNLEDLWGETKPQNIPGTSKEYPNWRRRFKAEVREWESVLKDLRHLSDLRRLNQTRPCEERQVNYGIH